MIRETIVTSVAADGTVHIAPMGVREQDGQVILAPFRPSTTLENVLATHCAVVNLSDDVRIFAGCLTGRRWATGCSRASSARAWASPGCSTGRSTIGAAIPGIRPIAAPTAVPGPARVSWSTRAGRSALPA